MLTMMSMKQMRTSRNVCSFRACLHAAGLSAAEHDNPRLIGEERALMLREARRLWLDKQWLVHFKRAAGPLRVLPPAAREQQASAW